MSKPRGYHPFCSGCGKPRVPGPEFYNEGSGIPRTHCKACMRRQAEEWKRRNPEKHRAIFRRCNHRSNLRLRFGLTLEQFSILAAASNGLCAICAKPESRSDRSRLSLDHDRDSGALRGFLCSRCNLAIGGFNDDVVWMQRALDYLRSGVDLRDLLKEDFA